ncbi:oligopeptide/dipeptide ABC transporter ATP-binding protein [Ensifer sp. Root31]|uniref:ABC transporter ATP-binding protein n=1 Tax=Ensifer sp. Root31 TaxID=1736512 RepID=UPI000A40A9A3|nr:oligopeptide/dipeptide ABC transporter ATP-binding protein [Ensifer sp. Root31]
MTGLSRKSSSAQPKDNLSPGDVDTVLEARDLHVLFSNGVRAVDGVSLQLHRGETLGVVGESGCGKSTLGRTLCMLQVPSSGKVLLNGSTISDMKGRNLRAARKNLQMVFQDPYSSLDPRQRAGQIISEPLLLAGAAKAQRQARTYELLDLVSIGPSGYSRFPREFSGGQRQRIGIARSLAANPKVIICDEPVSALDVSVQAQIVNLLVSLQKKLNLTYVFISHDLAVVRQMASRVAVMYLGRIVEIASADSFFSGPRHPYSAALLSAVPSMSISATRRKPIPLAGDPPSPINLPSGCRFHTRCWLKEKLHSPEICSTVDPMLAGEGNHQAACHFQHSVNAKTGD